jgi:uncharacterized protein
MSKTILLFTIACTIPLLTVAQDAELRYATNGFHADWFNAEDSNGSALIILGGAEGGNEFGNLMAPYFQSKGYHVLSLAFIKADGLNDQLEKVPIEMVEKAIAWIQSNQGHVIKKIGLIGGSKGAELALLSTTLYQNIDALVLISPTSVVWQSINEQDWDAEESSWTYKGKSLPFLRYDFSRGVERMYDFYNTAIDNLESPEPIIKAENIDCPVLLLSGKKDLVWPSKKMAEMIKSRLEEFNFSHPFNHHNFEEAGHLLIHPAAFDINAEWPEKSTFEFLGGSAESFRDIAENSLQKITFFLERNL